MGRSFEARRQGAAAAKPASAMRQMGLSVARDHHIGIAQRDERAASPMACVPVEHAVTTRGSAPAGDA